MQLEPQSAMAQPENWGGFELEMVDDFIKLGSAVIAELASLDEQYPAARRRGQGVYAFARDMFNNHASSSSLESLSGDWAGRMMVGLGGEAKFREAACLFQLHCGAVLAETGVGGLDGLVRTLLRDLVGPLLFRMRIGAEGSPLFSDLDRTVVICQTMAVMLGGCKPQHWEPSWFCTHPVQFSQHFWPAFGQERGHAALRPLCRQIVEQRIWMLPDGRFSPEAGNGALAQPLRIPGPGDTDATLWRQRLRGLLVEALRCGWISGAEAESVIALDPALEPWWLLSSSSAQMEQEPAQLRAFQARLRARFPARLEELARGASDQPEFQINLQFDRENVLKWEGWYQTEHAFLVGGEGVVGAARWAAAHPGQLGSRNPTAWATQMRRLAFIEALDSGESADALVDALKAFPASALAEVLPWARCAQPLILRAMGLAELEPLRCWLVTQAGQDPHAPMVLGDAMHNDSDPAKGVIDLAGLLRATAGIEARRCEQLVGMYTKAGMASGMDELVAAALGRVERGKVLDAALVKQNQNAIKRLGLLPDEGLDDVRERYLALQKLGRMARQHGAQRQATQLGSVQAGLSNLAQVAGYPDRAELEWVIEGSQGAAMQGSFAPAPFGDYQAWIAIEQLKPVLMLRNEAGKLLTAVPAALKKDEAFTVLRSMFAEVKEQLPRFTRVMENRMMTGTSLTAAQLEMAMGHPVMAPVIASLVWSDEAGHTGLYRSGMLDGPDGCHAARGALRLVHGAQLLLQAGGAFLLAYWQRRLVEGAVVQAFKQMFREIYVPTPAELEAVEESSRYAGRGIRTGMTQAILQSRGWIPLRGEADDPSHQRLFADGVTAHCRFSAGRFFTQEELEQVREMWFTRAGKRMTLGSVPGPAFSEAMRDINLVVSKAGHGDDGLAVSLATMDARAQLLQAIGQAMPKGALSIIHPFVHVKGKLASYRIHLGSGHIHIEPGAYLCIVPDAALAGKQTRLRLPFVEDDVQTAALVSKVMLLLDDDKIKDASILAQLRKGQ